MQDPVASRLSAEVISEITAGRRSDHTPQISVDQEAKWPPRPAFFEALLTPIQAAQYLRLDEIGHTPRSAIRVLNYWRSKSQLRATKYARRVWFLKTELDRFLQVKTES
jgi:hypothetical protein